MGDRCVRLVVLFGGRSAEHDVSCVSARHVLDAADPRKYRIEPVGITRQGDWVLPHGASAALESGSPYQPTDRLDFSGREVSPLACLKGFEAASGEGQIAAAAGEAGQDEITVVMPVLHGPMGEDGTVQGWLELADVPYVGAGVLASALCMDKAMAKTVMEAAGFSCTRWRTAEVDADTGLSSLRSEAAAAVRQLGLPLFVKPSNSGSSIGISKASSPEAVVEAMRLASEHDRLVIVEEAADGREIEVAVLGNDEHAASVPGEIVPSAEFYTYDDKYSDGAELLIPAPLDRGESEAARSLAAAVCRELRVEGLARVDFFYEDGRDGRGSRGWLVNEVNTMPGFTPISMYPKLWEASGLPYADLIDRLVELAVERHDRCRRRRVRVSEPL